MAKETQVVDQKTAAVSGFFMALFIFCIFNFYAYAWWVAHIIVSNKWMNYGYNNYGEEYRFSNIFIAFQSLVFALFTIPMMAPMIAPIMRGLIFIK